MFLKEGRDDQGSRIFVILMIVAEVWETEIKYHTNFLYKNYFYKNHQRRFLMKFFEKKEDEG